MSGLSTHVLDLAAGRPASEVAVCVFRRLGERLEPIGEHHTDANGRALILGGGALEVGGYRLAFAIGAYFARVGAATSAPPFLDVVNIDFAVADAAQHHHVPLLVSPFGYSTYRGS